MTVAVPLLVAHALAACFGIVDMLVAMRRPELWAHSDVAHDVFVFGLEWGGALQIALGAAAVACWSRATIGWRRTLVFLVASVGVSLGAELVGTRTGWPFGAYEYGEVLGPKALGRVPWAIPLSWFALGLSTFALGAAVAARRALGTSPWLAVGVGGGRLTGWALALDPAMAHESMPLRFWYWHEEGAYFGMPIKNFVGWALTAGGFMGLAGFFFGDEIEALGRAPAFPTAMYAINVAFAAVLDASVGLWTPIALAVVLGVLPALLLARRPPVVAPA